MAERENGIAVENASHSSDGAAPPERILALEVRPQRLGFVVLQGVTRPLDWGLRLYCRKKGLAPSAGCAKVATLLDLYAPAAVVIRRRSGGPAPHRETARATVSRVAAELRRRSVACQFVTTKEVRRFFFRYGGTTKHEIASILAEWYEDLAWKLPLKRRPWNRERYSTLIFDAVATAVTFLGREK